MQVTLIQRPEERLRGRKTIMLDQGRGPKQVGFYRANKPVAFTQHLDGELAAAIAAEVARIEDLAKTPAHFMPPPTPPEWLEPEEVSPILIP